MWSIFAPLCVFCKSLCSPSTSVVGLHDLDWVVLAGHLEQRLYWYVVDLSVDTRAVLLAPYGRTLVVLALLSGFIAQTLRVCFSSLPTRPGCVVSDLSTCCLDVYVVFMGLGARVFWQLVLWALSPVHVA